MPPARRALRFLGMQYINVIFTPRLHIVLERFNIHNIEIIPCIAVLLLSLCRATFPKCKAAMLCSESQHPLSELQMSHDLST